MKRIFKYILGPYCFCLSIFLRISSVVVVVVARAEKAEYNMSIINKTSTLMILSVLHTKKCRCIYQTISSRPIYLAPLKIFIYLL